MTEQGTVVRVVKDIAYMRFCGITDDDCGGCKACLFSRPAAGEEEPVYNTLNAKPGDLVKVERRGRKTMPALVLFGLPIIALIVSAVIVSRLSEAEWAVALIALISAVTVFLPLVALDKYLLSSGRLGSKMLQIAGAVTDDNSAVLADGIDGTVLADGIKD